MKQLKDKNAAIIYVGRKTVLKFDSLIDGVASYETAVPKNIEGDLCYLIVEVFQEDKELLDYMEMEHLTNGRQLFQLLVSSPYDLKKETLYCKKYVNPENN